MANEPTLGNPRWSGWLIATMTSIMLAAGGSIVAHSRALLECHARRLAVVEAEKDWIKRTLESFERKLDRLLEKP